MADGLRPTMLRADQPLRGWSLQERMAHYRVPGVAIAVVRNGQIVQATGFGVGEAGTDRAVDADMMFSVGSISKMVTAATALRLVAEDRLDLDRDIGLYLKSWGVPPAPELTNSIATMRIPLSPSRFTAVSEFMPPQFEFHRATNGTIQSLSINRGTSSMHYRRQVKGNS